MADLVRQGLSWLEGMRKKHLSGQVVYKRDEQVLTVNATIGRTEYVQGDSYGSEVTGRVVDFLIAACDLGLDPELGDMIEVDGHEYQVSALADEVWRWSDPYRVTMRIHTKQTDGV